MNCTYSAAQLTHIDWSSNRALFDNNKAINLPTIPYIGSFLKEMGYILPGGAASALYVYVNVHMEPVISLTPAAMIKRGDQQISWVGKDIQAFFQVNINKKYLSNIELAMMILKIELTLKRRNIKHDLSSTKIRLP